MSASPPVVVCSSLLPVPHGFTTREGGVSEGVYASLNLGFAVGDVREHVEENHRRLAARLDVALGALHTVKQVHGDRVVEAGGGQGGGDTTPASEGEADGVWTGHEGHWVGVGTADCVPILLVDPDGRRVAAVHSGWKGTEARIVARAVEALVARGARPARLLAAVGPCIQRCCYVVSEELAGRFGARFGAEVLAREAGQVRLDLSLAVGRTLREAGLGPERVEVLGECTACDARRFFSHRRDAGRTGRHLNFVINRF